MTRFIGILVLTLALLSGLGAAQAAGKSKPSSSSGDSQPRETVTFFFGQL